VRAAVVNVIEDSAAVVKGIGDCAAEGKGIGDFAAVVKGIGDCAAIVKGISDCAAVVKRILDCAAAGQPTRLFTAKFSANFLSAPTCHASIKKGCINLLRPQIFESKLFCVKTNIVANF